MLSLILLIVLILLVLLVALSVACLIIAVSYSIVALLLGILCLLLLVIVLLLGAHLLLIIKSVDLFIGLLEHRIEQKLIFLCDKGEFKVEILEHFSGIIIGIFDFFNVGDVGEVVPERLDNIIAFHGLLLRKFLVALMILFEFGLVHQQNK